MRTVTLRNNWSYDRMTRLFGGMWFMWLSVCVAKKIGALREIKTLCCSKRSEPDVLRVRVTPGATL